MILFFRFSYPHSPQSNAKIVVLLTLFAIVGYTNAKFRLGALFDNQFVDSRDFRGEVEVKGRVDCSPERIGDTLRFTLKTSEIISDKCHIYCEKYLLIKMSNCDSRESEPIRGDVCITKGRFFNLGYGRYEAIRKNCTFGLSATYSQCRILKDRNFSLQRFSHLSRKFLCEKLNNSMGGRDCSLIEGVMFGRRKGEQSNLHDTLGAAGLSHIVAVSGLHVACFTFTVLFILLRVGFGRRSRYLLASFAGGIILTLSGFRPSACRAFIMCAIYFLGKSTNRTYDPLTGLSLAGIIMAGLNTSVLLDTGFQLSFAATLGICALANQETIEKKVFGYEKVRKLLSVTSAAQLAVIPLLILHGESISLLSVIANLLVVPLIGPLLVTGWLTVLVSLLHPGIGRLFGFLPFVFSRAAYYVAVFASKVPAAQPLSTIGIATLFIYMTGLVLLVRRHAKRRQLFIPFVLILVAVTILLLPGLFQGMTHGGGRIVFMDVGQGDAILIEDGSGGSILFDAGPEDRKAMEKLSRLGVSNLEALIISHPHSDHIAGIKRILESIPVGVILKPGIKGYDSNTLRRVEETIREKNIPVINASKGMVLMISKKLSVRILHPDDKKITSCENVNDCSVVAVVKLGNLKLLLPGDIEKETQISLVDGGVDLSCSVLKIPHQGSPDAFCTEFLRACNARLAVISVEKNNKYGHPSRKFVTRLRKDGVRVYRTDHDGDITVLFNDGRIRAISGK